MSDSIEGESKLHFLDYWRVIRVRYGIILLAFGLVVLSTGIATWLMPRSYTTQVLMQVQSDPMGFRPFGSDEGLTTQRIDPVFANTQHEIMKSGDVLIPIVEQLGLAERWSGDSGITNQQAFQRLRRMFTVTPMRNSNLLRLTVGSRDPGEAAELANAIAQRYVEAVSQRIRNNYEGALGGMMDEVEKQREIERTRHARMLELREEIGIIDITSENATELVQPIDRLLVAKTEEANMVEGEITSTRALLSEVRGLDGDALVRALTTIGINDPVIQRNFPAMQDAMANRSRLLESGLGPKHPRVAEADALIKTFSEQLQDQVVSIERSLQTRLQVSLERLAQVRAQQTALEAEVLEAKRKGAEYTRAKAEYNEARRILEALETSFRTREMNETMPLVPAEIWEAAQRPEAPSSPNVLLNMILGVFVGLIFGAGLAFFIEYLDTSVKTMEDVESFLEVPVLAVIPRNVGLLHAQSSESPDAEAYRILRTNIEFNRRSAEANAVTVVSGGSGEGKSTTLANLGFVCSQGGYKTLIIDADLRRPVQHKLFGVSNELGLTNYLTTNMALEEAVIHTGLDNLYLLPSGTLPTDAVGVLNSQRMAELITEVKARFDLVLFDSPPILGVSDASVLASEVDLTIIVVQHRRFPKNMLMRVKQAVENVGGTVVGVVLNNVDLKHDPNYSYYTSYYSYYSPERTAEKTPSLVGSKRHSRGGGDEY